MKHARQRHARSTGHASRTHRAPTGFYAPMPQPLDGEVGRVLQGGEPPVPYRTRNDWSRATKGSPEPFACRQIKGEVWSDRKATQ